jgi:cation transport ATPase
VRAISSTPRTPADAIWTVTVGGTVIVVASTVVRSLIRGDLGVDVNALLAMAGALVGGEVLAGSLVAVMLTGGSALEGVRERARAERADRAAAAGAERRTGGEGAQRVRPPFTRMADRHAVVFLVITLTLAGASATAGARSGSPFRSAGTRSARTPPKARCSPITRSAPTASTRPPASGSHLGWEPRATPSR